ncbi:MAG: hypothetical protein Q9217_000821 [Psora testacea]
MSEKKRKRAEYAGGHLPQKKVAAGETIEISVLENEKQWMPVLASTPGHCLPPKASFKPFVKTQSKAPELLLHSDAHPKLDYTASEEASNGSDGYLIHYIGVYDSQRGKLQLVPARKMVIRSTLKSARRALTTDSEGEQEPTSKMSARNALGLAFGTKKSQKAIRSLTANAISPSKPSSQPSSSRSQLEPLAQAVVSSMPSTSTTMMRDALEAEIDESKPRPKPNLQATTPAEVYTISQLVDGEDTLSKIPVKEWIDTINSSRDVLTRSLYVSRRLIKLVQANDVKMVRVLKYLYLLIEWAKALQQSGKAGKRVPKLEHTAMAVLVAGWGSELVLGLSKRFAAEGGILNRWHQDYLITHILALTLLIDGFVVDTYHIQQDLKLDTKQVAKYYRELGCAVSAPTKVEQERMGMLKAEAQARRMVRLKIPLTFPKQRGLAMRKKR